MLSHMPALSSVLRSFSAGLLARNTGALLLGHLGRVVIQGLYFVLVARALGVQAFGALSGVVALVALIAPFGSLGALQLMIRHIVRDPASTPNQFALAVKITAAAGVAATIFLLVLAPWIASDQISLTVLAAVAIADLLGARLVEVAGGVYSAKEQMGRTAVFQLWLYGARLVGAVGLLASPVPFTLGSFALVYLATSAVTTAVVVSSVRRQVGPAVGDLKQFRSEWREGILFSFSLASQSVYNDIDKAMLARLSTLEATGIYTAAYRVVDMAFTPMRSLLGAAYPSFFRYGKGGLRPALAFAKRLAAPGVGYCLLAGVVILAGADLVPLILGEDFAPSVGPLRALSLLPVLRAAHYLAADALTGAGYQGMRSAAQLAVAGANVLLNFVLIPVFGYWGAVYASIASDGVLAALLWIIVAGRIWTGRRERCA